MRAGNDITIRNFKFGGFSFSEYMVVESISRNPIMEVENSFLTVPGRDGYFFTGNRLKSKKVTLHCRLFRDRWYDLNQAASFLAAKLYTKNPEKLELYDTNLAEYVLLDGEVDFSKANETGEVTISFINPTGKSFGQKYTQGFKDGDKLTLINLGTGQADFIIKAQSTNTSVKVNRVKPDMHLRFDDLAVGEKITIDSEYMGIRELAACKALSLDSRFFKLSPGSNKITFSGLTGTIEWSDTWI